MARSYKLLVPITMTRSWALTLPGAYLANMPCKTRMLGNTLGLSWMLIMGGRYSSSRREAATTLKKIRDEGTSEDMIQQEWYCSFTLGIQGSYFAKYIEEAKEDGRICNVK